MNAHEIIDTAAKLVSGDRKEAYGDVLESLGRVAVAWNAHLTIAGKGAAAVLDAVDVAWMMSGLKHARAYTGPHRIDNYIDAVGWAAVAGEAVERLQGRSDKAPEQASQPEQANASTATKLPGASL